MLTATRPSGRVFNTNMVWPLQWVQASVHNAFLFFHTALFFSLISYCGANELSKYKERNPGELRCDVCLASSSVASVAPFKLFSLQSLDSVRD